MAFGENMIAARKKRGLSQEQLGEIVQIDKRIISRYETNKTIPSIEVARKIAEALRMSLDHLMGLSYSLFIDDPEMRKLLRDYDAMEEKDKLIVKKLLRAFRLYSQLENTQNSLAV